MVDKELDILESVRDISSVPVTEQNYGGFFFDGEKPAMKPLPIFGLEIDIFISQVEFIRSKFKEGLRKEDKEIFDPRVESIEKARDDKSQGDQYQQLERHERIPGIPRISIDKATRFVLS